MAYRLTIPRHAVIGEGAMNEAKDLLQQCGKKAFIVTGKNVTKHGLVAKLEEVLASIGMEYEIFNDITSEPTVEMIEQGVTTYKKSGADFFIGLGGGSPLDSVKAIAVIATLGGEITDYMGKEIQGNLPKMVLIPTTAGTGSEATKFTIITDTKKNVKMLLKGESLVPDVAIIDPILTMSAPKSITAATGMDALTHAVESYTSRKRNSITDGFAISAIKKIFEFLPRAYKDGSDLEAREQMLLAAYEAGICINNASVTLVHGMSRPIGALFHVPHGISNAMLLEPCLTYALDGCYERFATVAREIGAATDQDTDQEAAVSFLGKIRELCTVLEIPTLQQYGIEQEAFEAVIGKMARDGMASGSPLNTIKEVTEEDLVKIYEGLF